VDITPSALCQIEANQVYPSLPLLLDIAGVLGLSLDSLFKGLRQDSSEASAGYMVYKKKDQTARRHEKEAKGASPLEIVPLLPPEGRTPRIAPYLLRIGAGRQGMRSFFDHKGPEFGWVLNGLLRVTLEGREFLLRKGDSVYMERGTIKRWRNEGPGKAEVLWVLL
jgi:mannose-6-phosphate isomerase-like protein (cupin superfamily)